MSEQTSSEIAPKIHPTKDRIEHLRHQIIERIPSVRRIFSKSGTIPTNRLLINAAGEKLRQEYDSDRDLLTNLWNKKAFERESKYLVIRAKKSNQPITAVSIDLDELKNINDQQGHKKGDELISTAADAIRAVSRVSDVFGRVGGDEFNGFLNTDNEGSKIWVTRIREEFAKKGVKASIGTSNVDLDNIENSIANADANMYTEKRSKKGEIKTNG